MNLETVNNLSRFAIECADNSGTLFVLLDNVANCDACYGSFSDCIAEANYMKLDDFKIVPYTSLKVGGTN